MKLIIGLGNPETKYKNNRHNVGHMVIDELALVKRRPLKNASGSPTFKVLKSDKYMNDSGLFIKNLKDKYPKIQMSDLYVIYDDLDIPLGSFKIQFGKGPKVHNGLNDIYKKINTTDFWHIRVGVDNRNPESRAKGREYVLEDFSDEEKIVLNSVMKQICNRLLF